MVKPSTFETLEIVFLFRPVGVPLGERRINNLVVSCRDGQVSELESLDASARNLTLFVASPHQFAQLLPVLEHQWERGPVWRASVGFLLIDDVACPATVRTRKRIQASTASGLIVGDLRHPYSFNQLLAEMNNACQHLFLASNRDLLSSMVAIRDLEAKSINEVGLAMMMGQSSLDELMRLVLEKATELSQADAGFLLLRENLLAEPVFDENNVKLLRRVGSKFIQKYRICRSQNVRLGSAIADPQLSGFTAIVANRACGMAWLAGRSRPIFHSLESFSFPDVDVSAPELEFDKRAYHLKSWCAFPLRTPSCDVVGFILLINRRISSDVFCDSPGEVEKFVTEFNAHDMDLLGALANQAGVSIDHARLYKDLRTLFESFVQASVVAIESRDPTTKGHSERVAVMTVGLAEAVNRTTTGAYGSISFNPSQLYELRYAALLHDFGKIGVREDVLCKEKKLHPAELSGIRERFSVTQTKLQIGVLEAYVEGLLARGDAPRAEDFARVRAEMRRIEEEFTEFWSSICDANEPNVVSQDAFQKIARIAALRVAIGKDEVELLTESEIGRLSLHKGSLSPDERREIESHVEHSYRFLIQIPWSSDLANIPDIVYAHHERLDGSGYPRGLVDARDAIPIQAKLMAITDIYDALVAMDRPYKKAIPQQRALSILEAEVRDGKLDSHLFEIFVQARILDLVTYPDLKVA